MNGPRLTEERLRYHLDSNQVMRERLCLAIMPLLGPYTQERPRRPKGGPDGGRDIEAVFQGSTVVWGAVGFRNGGGNDDAARRDAQEKFDADLSRALSENPGLQGFVFFTNVDLTPGIIEHLKSTATARDVAVVDVCDMERLRHALDSPEGLIARLQYLDIAMSATEQIALVNKFGNQLQQAVLARFDRVERTLSQMERFLGFQTPLHRLDVYVALKGNFNSADIGDEALLLRLDGLQDLGKSSFCLCVNHTGHKGSHSNLVVRPHFWLGENPDKVISFVPSIGLSQSLLTAYCELSLTTGGHRVRIADLTVVNLTVYVTSGLHRIVDRVVVDLNGYEIFNCPVAVIDEKATIEIPTSIAFDAKSKTWKVAIARTERNILFDSPRPSGRHYLLRRNTDRPQQSEIAEPDASPDRGGI
jgi:hypothetical protein